MNLVKNSYIIHRNRIYFIPILIGVFFIFTAFLQAQTDADSLAISVTDERTIIRPNELIRYTITLTNSEQTTNVGQLISYLSPYVEFDTDFNGGLYESASHTVLWNSIELSPTSTRQLSFLVKSNTTFSVNAAIITNTVTFSSAGTNLISAMDTSQIEAEADLAVQISASKVSVLAGESFTYDISVDNVGSRDASNVAITSTHSPYLKFLGASDSGIKDTNANVIQWPSVDLVAGKKINRRVFVQIQPVLPSLIEEITSEALVNDSGPNASNNFSTVKTRAIAQPDLSITRTTSVTEIELGKTIQYTFLAKNTGNQDTEKVIVENSLSPFVTLISANPDLSSSKLAWSVGNLAVGQVITLNLLAKVNGNVPDGSTVITNTATITDNAINGSDLNLSNNSVETIIDLIKTDQTTNYLPLILKPPPLAQLQITQISPSEATVGQTTEIVYQVKRLDKFVTVVTNLRVIDDVAGQATCDKTVINPGQTATCRAIYTVPSTLSSPFLSRATATGIQASSAFTDYSIVVRYNPKLQVQIDAPSMVRVNEPLLYTVKVQHAADSDKSPVTNIKVTDVTASELLSLIGGDNNNNRQLDVDEIWTFQLANPYMINVIDTNINSIRTSLTGTDLGGQSIPAAQAEYAVTINNNTCTFYDFSSPKDWPTIDAGDRKIGYIDGEYQLTVKRPNYLVIAWPSGTYTDYTVGTKMRWANSDKMGDEYGIAFGIPDNLSSFYAFFIDNASGEYKLYYNDNTGRLVLVKGTNTFILSETKSNYLIIQRLGTKIKGFVNGQLIVDHVDTRIIEPRQTGVIASSQNIINPESPPESRFDNYLICPE